MVYLKEGYEHIVILIHSDIDTYRCIRRYEYILSHS